MIATQKKRDSNLELYRILVMLLIIAHHFVVNSGLLERALVEPAKIRSIFVLIFGAWGKAGINCFVLITGFYMCKSTPTLKKYLKLLFEVEFYNVLIYLIMLAMGYEALSFKSMLRPLIFYGADSGRFVSAFLLFYLFIPFLNILISNLNKGKHGLLVLACLFVYTIRGSIPGLEISMNYVTWFSIIYVIGAYLRMYYNDLPDILTNPRKNGFIMSGTIILSVVSILCGIDCFVNKGIARYYYYISDSNKILAVLLAVSTFLFFESHSIRYSKIINALGKTTFGVLLIHANSDAMRAWLWGTINPVSMFESKKIYVLSFLVVIGIFIVCSMIDWIRIAVLEKPIFNLLEEKVDTLENKLKSMLGVYEHYDSSL